MSIKRITISVPDDVARRIKRAAGAAPVSAWVTRVIEDQLDDSELERQWQAFYSEVAPTARDVLRASSTLKRLTRPRTKGGR